MIAGTRYGEYNVRSLMDMETFSVRYPESGDPIATPIRSIELYIAELVPLAGLGTFTAISEEDTKIMASAMPLNIDDTYLADSANDVARIAIESTRKRAPRKRTLYLPILSIKNPARMFIGSAVTVAIAIYIPVATPPILSVKPIYLMRFGEREPVMAPIPIYRMKAER